MTREDWKKYLLQEEIPLEVFYAYYLDNKDPNKQVLFLEEFKQLFPMFLERMFGVVSSKVNLDGTISQKSWDYTIIINKVMKYYEEKFNGT